MERAQMNEGTGQPKQVEFLRVRLQQEIDSFRKRRISNRTKAFLVKIMTVTLGALATVALGIKGYLPTGYESELSVFALCITAAVPILATWETFFDHRWLWIQYTATLAELYSISDKLEYTMASGLPLNQETFDELYIRLETALMNTKTAWSEKRLTDAERQKDNAASPHSK
jgi:SMODS and SLOG-associating 2TM effector domain 1